MARWIRLARPGASCACVFDRRPLPSSASSAPHARVVASTKSQRQATMDNDGIMTQLKKGDKVQDGDVIQLLLERISSEADPTKLVKMVLCWEGVASSAHYCSYKALLKLRSIGWTIVKNSQNSAEKAKRELLVQLMSAEYPEASAQSIAKYAINFAKYLQMSDEEFASVDRIRFTNVGKKQADPVKCIGFSKLDASIILGKLSSSSETDALSDSDDGSDSESDALSDSDDGSDSESLPSIEIEAHSETSSLRRSNRSTKTTPEDSTGSGKNQSKAVSTSSEEDRLKQKPAPPPAGKGKRRGRGKGTTEKKPKEDPVASPAPDSALPAASGSLPVRSHGKGGSASALSALGMWDPTISETAIATLQSMAKGDSMAIKDRLMWTRTLRSRCEFMQQLYENPDFMLLCEDTIESLDRYPGREQWNKTQMTKVFEHLAKYGWALSPRMWTREEILLMCVILVDPALYFDDIRQKDRGRSGEAFQNRGMAALDDRVQAVMHARLSAYGFVDSHSHLPSSVPAGVVLNSGGSYRQLSTWKYLNSARFVTDPSAQHSVIQVQGAPEYVFCNAFYIATTTKRLSGQPVYVSISPDEMYGPKSPSEWDSEPLVKSLSKRHPLVVLLRRPKTKSAGESWATERVTFWEDGVQYFQSVTAYGTNHFMMQIACNELFGSATSTKVITNFDWEKKNSIMSEAACSPIVATISVETGDARSHKLSFGLVKIPVRVEKCKPKATRCLRV